MFVNGWEITTRLAGTSEEYHIAKKEGCRVHTSKDINYLLRLCTERNQKEMNMFAVFQIEKTKEYQATIYMAQDAAFEAMTEMQLHNPDTKFEIRQQ